MRKVGAAESRSNRTGGRGNGPRTLRVEAHSASHGACSRVLQFFPPPQANGARAPVATEFFAVDRRSYALVGSGIPLAIPPRGARGTLGARRLNEETA